MNKNPILILIAVTALLIVLPPSTAVLSQQTLGVFQGRSEVGSPVVTSRATYDSDKQEYTVEGSGTNMWAGRDEFHFVWRRLRGDFIATANASFVGKGVEPHRKMGWIVRASLDADSPHAAAVVHGDGLTSLQFRRTKGVKLAVFGSANNRLCKAIPQTRRVKRKRRKRR